MSDFNKFDVKGKYHFIYVTTNIKSNKQYIGSHSTLNINDGYLGSGIILQNYINKIGKSYFKREILEFCNSNSEARKKESIYIKKYNTLKPSGYNISPTGGLGFKGCHSKESKIKISQSLKNQFKSGARKQWNTGKTFDDDYKKRMSIIISKIMKNGVAAKISKSMMGEKNPFYKGKFSDEALHKMSIAKKGKTWEEIYGKEKAAILKKNKSLRNSGKNNPMAGKSIMDVWILKYGKDEAKIRYIKWINSLKKSRKK